MKKRLLATILTMAVMMSLFAGCGSKQETGETTDATEATDATGVTESADTTDATDTVGAEEEASLLITEEAMELTLHMHEWDGGIIFEDDFPVFQKAAELTNISIKGTAPTTAVSSEELFNLMLASNEIPDIIHTNRNNVLKYNADLFQPLDELIDEHAPDLKAFLESRPDVKNHMKASDGHMYFIPYVPDGKASKGWFIRKDWLDELGLEVPETVEDYIAALKAFGENDMNGNGIDDEVGFFTRAVHPYDMLNLFGIATIDYIADGKVMNDRYTEKYKDAISALVDLYEDGVIDQEVFTRGGAARDIMFDGNMGGSTMDWFGSTSGMQTKYQDHIEGLNWIPIAPPADVNGKQWTEYSRSSVSNVGWGISLNNENPVETIKYLNFWFTEEGRILANFGIEGVTYDMVDGKPVFNEKTLTEGKSVKSNLTLIGAQNAIGFHQNFDYEKQWMNELALSGSEMYIENDYFLDLLPSLIYTEEEEKIIARREPEIDSYIREMSQKWILGAVSVEDTFDEYLAQLENLGANEVLYIKQAAYDRMYK